MGQEALFYEFSLERHVPADHLLRAIDRVVDLSGLRAHLRPFYSEIGRPSIDPDLMIRMLIVGYCFGIRSERRVCDEVRLNLAYRWFCRLGLEGAVPDHSTFSKNRHGRFRDSDLLRELFETTVRRCIDEGLVGGEGFAVDASLSGPTPTSSAPRRGRRRSTGAISPEPRDGGLCRGDGLSLLADVQRDGEEVRMPLTLIPKLTATPKAADTLGNGLAALMAPTRAEPGCLEYRLHRHADDPRTWILYETWRSHVDLDQHFEQPTRPRLCRAFLSFSDVHDDRVIEVDQVVRRVGKEGVPFEGTRPMCRRIGPGDPRLAGVARSHTSRPIGVARPRELAAS